MEIFTKEKLVPETLGTFQISHYKVCLETGDEALLSTTLREIKNLEELSMAAKEMADYSKASKEEAIQKNRVEYFSKKLLKAIK